MLVIHWARQNKTNTILANGIRPTYRKHKESGERKNAKGVYVYPYSRNKTLIGNWRRNLKVWDTTLGNYNGFVFRLNPSDFPLIAGDWYFNRLNPEAAKITSLQELTENYGDYFSGEIVNQWDWTDFEIIIPNHIDANRIMKIIKDREPTTK